MSEEQKQGIVVNPLHHAGAEAPQGGEQGNAAASSTPSSGDATQGQPTSQSSPQDSSSTPAAPVTDTSDTTASESTSSSTSLLGKIEGAIEGVVVKVEEGVNEVVQEVKDVFVPPTQTPAPTPAPAPIVVGGQVNGNVITGVANSANAAPMAPTVANSTQGLTAQPPLSLKVGLVGDAAPAAPAVQEESAQLPALQTGISEVDQIVESLMKNASLEAKIIVNTIKEYIVKMKPGKPIAQKEGILQQVGFYNALLSAINNLEADFRPTMQAILALLHAHKDGAFKETHVFRFVEHIPLSTDHRFGFRKIITLLKTLANPQTRQQLVHQIHFENVTKYGLNERGRTKLAAFFGK